MCRPPALAVLLLLVGCASPLAPEPREQPPNIVLLIADDMGLGDVGAFGGDLPTPSIDRLSDEGARLTRFYVAAPVCTPSRYALFTGRYPHRSRGGLNKVGMMLDPKHASHGLHEQERTIAEQLRNRGYATSLIGKWHLGHGSADHLPTRHGFDSFYGMAGGCVDFYTHSYGPVPDWYRGEKPHVEDGEERYATRLLGHEAVRQIKGREGDQPFFLTVSFNAPHYGKSVEGGAFPDGSTLFTRSAGEHERDGTTYSLYNSLQAPPETLARFAHIQDEKRRFYAAMVAELDEAIGSVLNALDAEGLSDDTLVLFFADHGADETVSNAGSNRPLRGAKHSTWDGGLRVPALLRWPERVPAGIDLEQVSSALDLLPTLLGISQSPLTEAQGSELDGIDLGSAWFEGQPIPRELVWYGRGGAILRWPWKLRLGSLYHLEEDPGERTNRAADEPSLAAELGARLEMLEARKHSR